MHRTIHPYGPRVFGFAINFALMLYRPLCVPVQAGEKPSQLMSHQCCASTHAPPVSHTVVAGAGFKVQLAHGSGKKETERHGQH